MNFQQAIKSGFKNFANFEGRASRSEHNYWYLFVFLIGVFEEIINPSGYITSLVFFIPNISIMIRRFHDINKSGWNYFWCLTIIGIFPVIYWNFFKKGDSGENFYGDDSLKNLDNSTIK